MKQGNQGAGQERVRLIPKRLRGPYSAALCNDPAPPELLLGIEQFNRGEFFEQHETLEELWRSEPDDVRYLYQGILQVGVGFYHLRRGNHRGAVSRLESGMEKLRWFAPRCRGVDVSALLADTEECLHRLLDLGPDRTGDFDWSRVPKVRLIQGRGVSEGES